MTTSASNAVSTAEARELLVDLVSIPSPSGEEERAATRLVEFFDAHDREAYLDDVGNVRAPGHDAVLLTSHIDTVPGDIPVRIEDTDDGEILWGRGSVDATGPLAAMAVAAVRTGVSFVGVVEEEAHSKGARHLVTDREAPAAVINGEPSGWEGITLGYRGMLAGTYEAESDSGHSSRPDPNAIQHATAWWGRVEAAVDEVGGDEDGPVFEQVTAKPVAIEGGPSADGLAVEATLDIQLRIPPSTDAETLRGLAEDALDVGSVEWTEPTPPTMESPRTPVARALRGAIRAEGGEPRLLRKTGTADVNLYAEAWDCPMATYGPGDSDLDHAPDERLELTEYDRAVAVLEATCERLVSEHSTGTDDTTANDTTTDGGSE